MTIHQIPCSSLLLHAFSSQFCSLLSHWPELHIVIIIIIIISVTLREYSIQILMTVVIGSTPTNFINYSVVLLSFMETSHIYLMICISALSNFNLTSTSKCLVSCYFCHNGIHHLHQECLPTHPKSKMHSNCRLLPKVIIRRRQGHRIQAHIPPLSNCKDTGEEPCYLHNSKRTKHHPCNTGTKQLQ